MTTTDPFADFQRAFEENGFANDSEHISESFGDRMIVMRGPELLVRFVSDRDHRSIDLASTKTPELWFDGGVVLEMFGRGLASAPAPVQVQMAELRAILPEVMDAFDRKHFKATRKQLEKIEHARAQALFGSLSPMNAEIPPTPAAVVALATHARRNATVRAGKRHAGGSPPGVIVTSSRVAHSTARPSDRSVVACGAA